MDLNNTAYIVIDWGTTNFRAFALDENDKLLDTKSSNSGLLQMVEGAFPSTLQSILENWLPNFADLPVFMAGMVGSARGWVNVDYATAPTSIDNLWAKAHKFVLPWGSDAVIFPGICYKNKQNEADVMRGEELQIFGLSQLTGLNTFNAILPGTHSKHVQYCANHITQFESFMTGEVYSVLLSHSLLGKGVDTSATANEAEFLKGLESIREGKLTNKIFLNWSQRLFGKLNANDVPDYLSGMLIGYELRDIIYKNVFIVGGTRLSQHYKLACNKLDINATILDGNECFLAGMTALKNSLE